MMAMDERLKVLILRTLGLSQEGVAGVLHCAKQSVVEVERWFREDPRGEGLELLDDQRIRRLVSRDFPSMELLPAILIRAGQITADDLLLHYGRVSQTDTRPTPHTVEPVYARRLEKHWASLRRVAATLREQLSPPSVRVLFSAEVCQMAHAAAESGARLPSGDRWKRVCDAPVEIRAAPGGEGAIEARLLVEDDFLYSHLVSHLRAEFPEFRQIDAWTARLAKLIQSCLLQALDITLSCSSAAGLPYMGVGVQDWITYQFPAYLCQVVLDNPGRETAPALFTEAQSDGSWRLRPTDYPAITLAAGSATTDARCREACDQEFRRIASLEAWRQIKGDLERLESAAAELRVMLSTVIERGDFRGTCPLCEGYFSSPRDS